MESFRGRKGELIKWQDLTVIEMLKLIYEKYKDTDYDLLDDFMLWLKENEEK
jgi:hypothetical protein